jgi:hypothetical protein
MAAPQSFDRRWVQQYLLITLHVANDECAMTIAYGRRQVYRLTLSTNLDAIFVVTRHHFLQDRSAKVIGFEGNDLVQCGHRFR